MEDELTNKIKNTLKKTQKEESDIVYLMVKIRKFLGKNGISEYKILNSYCDWSLHDKIGHNKTCQNILGEVEKKYKKTKDVGPYFIRDILNLYVFKRELESFLQSLGIKEVFLSNEEWLHFRKLFINNLADCPIEPKNKTGLVEKFVFKESSNCDINFEIKLFNKEITINGSISERPFELEGKL